MHLRTFMTGSGCGTRIAARGVETAMKYVLSVMMAAGFFCIAMAAFAQSITP